MIALSRIEIEVLFYLAVLWLGQKDSDDILQGGLGIGFCRIGPLGRGTPVQTPILGCHE